MAALGFFQDSTCILPILAYTVSMMTKDPIKGYFNPRNDSDTFKGLGLSMGMDGELADKVYSDLHAFLKAAGRDYYIKKVPAGVLDPNGAVNEAGDIVPGWIECDNQYHLVRSSDHRVVSPHTVTESYAPLSVMDVAEEVAPWVSAGWASPDAVFSARGGSMEVLVLRLDAQGEITDDDFFVHYVVIQNPHGSGGKAKGKIISFRIVCANTFAAAVSMASDFTISHRVARGDADAQAEIMKTRAADAVAAWDKVKDHISELSKRLNVWNDAEITFSDAENLTDKLLEITDLEKASGRKKNVREAIMGAFNLPEFGTYGRSVYDWVNAVTFTNSSPHSQMVQKSKVETVDRAIRNMDPNGTGFKLEQKAEKIATGFLN